MDRDIQDFVKKYSEALKEDYAAIFAGAGLSVSSGYVDWKMLLKEMAESIELDIEKESDLIAVAQYYTNKYENRNEINQTLINNFTKETKANVSLTKLTELPIKTYWTTNYDSLIETTLRNQNKKVDVKKSIPNLSINLPDKDVVLYKMHGDIESPDKAIITKDDYEAYTLTHSLFITALQGDLISKTFLFIGFSFEDPNLNLILSRIRLLLGQNKRIHYCFFEKINRKKFDNDIEYNYALIKQELKIKDLLRYSIKAIMLDSYKEIPKILDELNRRTSIESIFISGSAAEYGNFPEPIQFISKLSQEIVKNKFKLVTGFGNGVGPYVINGALNELATSGNTNYDKQLLMRPAPYDATKQAKVKKKYHTNMIDESGVVIFVFGNKNVDNNIVNSSGVREEFEMAKKKKKYIIPIGSTGYCSEEILNEIVDNIKDYSYLNKYIDTLLHETDHKKIIDTVIKILSDIREVKL